jgi:hypothetical protein
MTHLNLMLALFVHLFLCFRPFFVVLHLAYNRLNFDLRQRTGKVVVEGEFVMWSDISRFGCFSQNLELGAS